MIRAQGKFSGLFAIFFCLVAKESLGETSLERRVNELEAITAGKLQHLQEELIATKNSLHQVQQEQEMTKRELAKRNITGVNYSSECLSPS